MKSISTGSTLSAVSCCLPCQVERYLDALLPGNYWVGASRAGVGNPYTLTEGSAISQVGQCCLIYPLHA